MVFEIGVEADADAVHFFKSSSEQVPPAAPRITGLLETALDLQQQFSCKQQPKVFVWHFVDRACPLVYVCLRSYVYAFSAARRSLQVWFALLFCLFLALLVC